MNRTRQPRHRSGFLLVVTMFTMVVVASVTLGLIGVSALDLRLVNNHIQSLRAYYVAEAGVADALWRIRQQGPLPNSTWQTFFPTGMADRYRVTVSSGSCTIQSVGTAAASTFTRALQVRVRIYGSSAPYTLSVLDWREVTL